MKSLQEVLFLSTDYLKKAGIANPRRQAEELLSDVLHLPRLQLYLEFERPLSEGELARCRSVLSRRAKGEPPQYIRGEVEFHDCMITVSRDVLIPRQETAILVEKIMERLSREDLTGKTLWDVCCGSGCIGIALKKRFPQLEVVLTDISPPALSLAQENAKKNDVSVTCLQGDLLVPFAGKKTHFFVCNPPYISEKEFQELDREVREYEPLRALCAGVTGLEFFERLAKELPDYLYPSGKAWMEIGYQQGAAALSLFQDQRWKTRFVEKDWAGHDRFFFLEIE